MIEIKAGGNEVTVSLTPVVVLGELIVAVTDAETGFGIDDALVELVELGLVGVRFLAGFYKITDIPPGYYTLRISAEGYETTEL